VENPSAGFLVKTLPAFLEAKEPPKDKADAASSKARKAFDPKAPEGFSISLVLSQLSA